MKCERCGHEIIFDVNDKKYFHEDQKNDDHCLCRRLGKKCEPPYTPR